jgi:diguanylate cyclase (GGDEF)-like protein
VSEDDRPLTSTVPDDLVGMLDLLAETIVSALGFGVAVVNISQADGSMAVVSVAGDASARETLLGSVDTAATWTTLLAASEPWGRLRFIDHSNDAAYVDALSWVPDVEPGEGEDAWHPEDALFAPLTATDGRTLGILSVDLPHDGKRPTAATCSALEAFAISTALALEHATLRARAEASERRFRELATRDWLTGVGNRSMLWERAQRAVEAAGSSLTVVFVDLDSFKVINDRHSHEAGDRVLRAVAQQVRGAVRPEDTVVRWGGDEFLVLAEGLLDEEAGWQLAQRVSAAVSGTVLFGDVPLTVTASVGVAFRHAADTFDADELVRRADSAMYDAKASGPNRCASHGDTEVPLLRPA